MEIVFKQKFLTPLGNMFLYASPVDENSSQRLMANKQDFCGKIHACLFEDQIIKYESKFWIDSKIYTVVDVNNILNKEIKIILDYFSGGKNNLWNINVDFTGYGNYTANVLQKIFDSPKLLWTYKELAKECENEKAFQATGSACATNRCLIIIPCHRVNAQSSKKENYSGGIKRKAWLQKHENEYQKQLGLGQKYATVTQKQYDDVFKEYIKIVS